MAHKITRSVPPDRLGPEAEIAPADLEVIAGGIGSQSSGAGAGKVTFNPFSITRKIDVASSALFIG